MKDGDDGTATSTTAVTVLNVAPTAVDDANAVDVDCTLTLAAGGVLGNDTDAGDSLTAELVGRPRHGTLTLHPDGSFNYIPDAGYVGPDSFAYRASDNCDLSDVATVAVDVQPLPTVVSVQLNDGSAQRSTVTQLVVTFNRVVTIAPDAFQVQHVGGDLVGLNAVQHDAGGRSVW